MWGWSVLLLAVLVVVFAVSNVAGSGGIMCPGSQMYCPGVGCVSGPDKCFPGSKGGASAVFSHEGFQNQVAEFPEPGVDVAVRPTACPAKTGPDRQMRQCPGGYRSDGACLMDFSSF